MIKVVNLADDTNVGGAMRGLTTIMRRFDASMAAVLMSIRAGWQLGPRLQGDIVILDVTTSWAKLLFLIALRLTCRGWPFITDHTCTRSYKASQVAHRGRFRLTLRLAFGLADQVAAACKGKAAWLRTARLVRPGKFVVIVQALDVSAPGDVFDMPAPNRPIRLGAYGRHTGQTGFEVVIEAMRIVRRSIATPAIAGYRPDEAMLHRAAFDLEHVTFSGKLAEPKRLLSGVEVLAPPGWEANGRVGSEAWATGRLAIASAVDRLIEQMNELCGPLVLHADPIVLGTGILPLATPDRVKMGRMARVSTAGRFADKTAAWQDLLRALVPNAKPGSVAVTP